MESSTTLPCPGCSGALTRTSVSDVDVYLCGECGGAWFDWGKLDKFVKIGPEPLDELMQRSSLEPTGAHTLHGNGSSKCPICGTALHPTGYKGRATIHLSACYRCGGVFIDTDSIQSLQRCLGQLGTSQIERPEWPVTSEAWDLKAHSIYKGIPPVDRSTQILEERVFGEMLQRFFGRFFN